ncbi:MAG: S-layer homology domain-containing protein [Eubacteriales bacterium]
MMRKICALLLGLTLAQCVGATGQFTDVDDHWAKDSIYRWADYGVVGGSGDLFRPYDFITRGDIAVIINQVMGYQIASENIFSDLGDTYYTDAVLKLNEAGVMKGGNGTVRPTSYITRQEAAIVLANALHIPYETVSATSFADDGSIQDWAKGAVDALNQQGLMMGRSGNLFDPTQNITRGEIAGILSKGIGLFVPESGSYSQDEVESVVIRSSNVTLHDTKVQGDVVVSEGAVSGTTRLQNLEISGDLVLCAGGTASIYLQNVTVGGEVIVQKDTATQTSNLYVSGATSVDRLVLENGQLSISTASVTSGGVREVVVTGGNSAILNGHVNLVTVDEVGARLTVNVAPDYLNLREGAHVNGTYYGAGTIMIGADIPLNETPFVPDAGTEDSTEYSVKWVPAENGTLWVSTQLATAESLVYAVVTPDEGYELASLTYNTFDMYVDAAGNAVFRMPYQNVIVEAVFQPIAVIPLP